MILPAHDASTNERDRLRAEEHARRRSRSERELRYLVELAEAEADLRQAEAEYARGDA